MYNTWFYVLVGIILLNFLLDRLLVYLNGKRWSKKLPEQLKGIIDEERYKKSQLYNKTNRKFSFYTSTFSLMVMMLMLFLGGFALVDGLAREVSNHPIVISLLFFGILMFASDIINLPFSLYDTFFIEEKFGFNKTTYKTFFMDKVKSWLLGALLGGGILALVVWFYQLTTDMFWIYTWALIAVFSIFMSMFYSTLIVPLFNKQTPLEEGELKEAIKNLSNKVNFKLDDVFVIDGSKRSTKANAYFSGLGPKKRIVLFDTLINDLSTNEIVSVLAHEIGHYKKKHTLFMMVISVLQMGITLYILSLFIGNPELSRALNVEQTGFHLGLVAFGILYSPISTILGLGVNILSRKNEYEADAFAAKHYSPDGLASALKKLSVKNLSNLRPHPAYVFFNYSHPPLLNRLRALEQYYSET